MKSELFISRRLRFNDEESRRSSSNIGIAVSGIALSIIVMLLSITVVTGFKHEISNKIMGFDAQLTIVPLSQYYDDRGAIELDSIISQTISTTLPEATFSTVIRQPGILKTDTEFLGVIFRGYGYGHDTSFEKSNIIDGKFPEWSATNVMYSHQTDSTSNQIVVSEAMANKLSLSAGDKVYAYFFINGNVRTRRFTVTGIYRSNFGEFDKLVAYASPTTLQRLRQLTPEEGDAIEIKSINDPDEIIPAAAVLQSRLNAAFANGNLPGAMAVDNIYRSGAMYFNWLDLLDTNVIVILVLMSCVSGFTIISCLFILILERVRMIGLLKAIGATNRQIRRIFMLLGFRVVIKGLIVGNVIGLGLAAAQEIWHLIPLDPDAYYLTYVPVELSVFPVVALNIAVAFLAFCLMLIPSAIISRISPTDTMRFE